MSVFDGLEENLRDGRSGVQKKLTERVKTLERGRPWLIGIGVLGAGVAALSRLDAGTTGTVMAIVGAIVAALSGLAVAVFDFKKLELSADLAKVEGLLEKAIREGRAALTNLEVCESNRRALDKRRVHRLTAVADMREMTEQSLASGLPASVAAEAILKVAARNIDGAIGFDSAEYWTLSVFEVRGDELVRVAAVWADRAGEQTAGRSWKRGEGYSGVAWRDASEVIEEDTSDPRATRRYVVPGEKTREYDFERYRSVAAVPVFVGPDQEIWGIATATSDRLGRFKDEPPQGEVQAVDMVRDVAGIMALLAVANRAPQPSERDARIGNGNAD
ncbi:hypothetical protein [Sphingosinicella sp. CPCC 101087]|uniref:hypothetical protein n=1 Tax=Sphingosinicella sp. CPCC 101087 TaxID=2497754 RepID=UPI00101BEB67|nr:hypothetical protein [Sphingosinicella sp. CPCC 101087]